MTDQVSCLCHQSAARAIRLVSGIELLKCRACGLYARRDPPDGHTLVSHYRENYWMQYADEHTTDARANLFRHVMAQVEQRHPTPGHLLDIGCGPGRLLVQARALGWTATGIEPSEQAAEMGRTAGQKIHVTDWPVPSWPTDSAEAVVLLNVLDHLHDPVAAVMAAWRTLRPGGVLYLRVPNGPFHVALLARGWPAALARLSVFHLYGFGSRALRHLLTSAGFQDLRVGTAPLSQQDAYASREHDAQASLRRAAKVGLIAGYRAAAALGLNRFAWGPSLEATAMKPSR